MADMLYELEAIIHDRKVNPKEGSYTNDLLDKGINRMAQKVGEEASEVIVAATSEDAWREGARIGFYFEDGPRIIIKATGEGDVQINFRIRGNVKRSNVVEKKFQLLDPFFSRFAFC